MSDAKGLIFDINENEIMSHIEDGTLSQFLKSWRNAQLIKLAKEPQECKWYKGINSVETCWGDIDIKTFNKFKRQGAKFCPYCGRKIKVGK